METSEFLMVDGPERYGPSLGLYNPWVWITAILLLILIWFLSRHYHENRWRETAKRQLDDAVDRIYRRIRWRAEKAAGAPRNQVRARAEDLLEEVRRLIWPLVVLAPLGLRATNLERALEGRELIEEHDPEHGHGGHGHGGHDHAHGEHGHGEHRRGDHADGRHDHDGDRGREAAPIQTQAQAAQININLTARHDPPSAPSPPPPPPKPPTQRSPSDVDRLRAAVLAFSDYWSRPSMKDELRAAQRALITVPPAEDKHPKISGGH